GTGNNSGRGIALDTNGNIFVSGFTTATDFPTVGALQSTNKGGAEAFVAKFNPAGNALIYSTYLGGKSDDAANAIAVDPAGNAIVTGMTLSTNFPTANPAQSIYGGGGDGFGGKLNGDGSALVYSTYLGGSSAENLAGGFSSAGGAVAVDIAGNAFVTGFTSSSNFPVLNAFQPVKGANASLLS